MLLKIDPFKRSSSLVKTLNFMGLLQISINEGQHSCYKKILSYFYDIRLLVHLYVEDNLCPF